MDHFNYNGKLYPAGTPVIGADNRGLRFGDGLFETLKSHEGRMILLDEHLSRFWNGLRLMQFDLPRLFTKEMIAARINELLEVNKHPTARIRLTAVRGDGGLYDPIDLRPNLLIQSWPLNREAGINTNGLQLCIYRDAVKPCDQFSNIKHNNYLCYVMGAIFARAGKCNDAVLLNQHLRVCDSTIANIFIIKNKTIFTPSLAEGCVGGIMRQFLLEHLPSIGWKVEERQITEDFLMDGDEVFLSNSIYNIRWVASIANKTYGFAQTKEIYNLLGKTKAGVFC
jgi:branched-chain amino acid aminotransferase